MHWDLDNPDIPVDKPKEIKELEAMGQTNRESMPPREMDEKLEDAAAAIARKYAKLPGADYEGCVGVVSVALSVTGSALGGDFGTHMMSRSEIEAEQACRVLFHEEDFEYDS